MTVSDPLHATPVRPSVSVVICTRDRPDKIGAAVASVLANNPPHFDLTVVDQSKTPATREVLQPIGAKDCRLRYIHLQEAGLSRAYNTGIRETSASLIAFTDDDCLVPEDWIRLIVEAFNEEPAADLLYGQVVAKPTELSEAFLTPSLQLPKGERLSRGDGFKVIGMGANFAARRRLFDRIGGFDQALGGGGPLRSSQDFDLAYRAYRAGSVILLRPEVTLWHDGRRELDDWPGVLRNYGIGDGAFYSKHVRCGDMYALFLLLRRISSIGARLAIKRTLLRQRPRTEYLTGIFTGIREGLKFSINRSQRCYAQS
jgi:glycosyltransferase involved in cell wall biosynthesis